MAFVGTRDAERVRGFYRDKLGLRLVHEDNFALCSSMRMGPRCECLEYPS
jgi:catechol 2,3-dioxygenase-like lactoylglutathione lyase family enzyme